MVIEDGFVVYISEFRPLFLFCCIYCFIAYTVLSSELSANFPAEISLRVTVLGRCTPGRSPISQNPYELTFASSTPLPSGVVYRCKVSTEREKEYNDNACRAGGRLKERDGKLGAHDQSAAPAAEREGRRPSLATGL